MFPSMEAPLILFLVILLIVGPILGIIAFVGMRRLDEAFRKQDLQGLIARIYALEQRLGKLEKTPQPQQPAEPETAIAPSPFAVVPISPPPLPTTAARPPIPPIPPVPPVKSRAAAPPPPSPSGFTPPPLPLSH